MGVVAPWIEPYPNHRSIQDLKGHRFIHDKLKLFGSNAPMGIWVDPWRRACGSGYRLPSLCTPTGRSAAASARKTQGRGSSPSTAPRRTSYSRRPTPTTSGTCRARRSRALSSGWWTRPRTRLPPGVVLRLAALRAGLSGAYAHATALLQPRQQHDGSALLKWRAWSAEIPAYVVGKRNRQGRQQRGHGAGGSVR
jgi:hypothetical protein